MTHIDIAKTKVKIKLKSFIRMVKENPLQAFRLPDGLVDSISSDNDRGYWERV